jgi:hypothetical protein
MIDAFSNVLMAVVSPVASTTGAFFEIYFTDVILHRDNSNFAWWQ